MVKATGYHFEADFASIEEALKEAESVLVDEIVFTLGNEKITMIKVMTNDDWSNDFTWRIRSNRLAKP